MTLEFTVLSPTGQLATASRYMRCGHPSPMNNPDACGQDIERGQRFWRGDYCGILCTDCAERDGYIRMVRS